MGHGIARQRQRIAFARQLSLIGAKGERDALLFEERFDLVAVVAVGVGEKIVNARGKRADGGETFFDVGGSGCAVGGDKRRALAR